MLDLNLHAERFVSLLEAAHREELECVHVVTEVELALLPDPQRSRGHKRVPLHNVLLREAAKKVLFLVAGPLYEGVGAKWVCH